MARTAVTSSAACRSASDPALAARLAAGIDAAVRHRASTVGVAVSYLQHFLDLAGMTRTYLGAGPYWGLTRVTAYDETLLLRLLLTKNTVLDDSSRNYELSLMARVIPSQRWGVPAGAPTRLTAHVKNVWLPLAPTAGASTASAALPATAAGTASWS